MAVPAWETTWTQEPRGWVDYANSLAIAFNTFKDIQTEVPKLGRYEEQCCRLKEMPWREIAREIADGVNRQDERLESANAMMGIEQLHKYVESWRAECMTVDKLINRQLFPAASGPNTLTQFSRPGIYEQPTLC